MPDAPQNSLEVPSRRRLLWGAALVAVSTGALLVATSAGLPGICEPLPMVWDEGAAIRRAEGITRWVGRWRAGDEAEAQDGKGDGANSPPSGPEGASHELAPSPSPLSREAIDRDWQYTTKIEGHPAFYGIVIAAGEAVSGRWLPPLDSARFGPMLLFALAAGAMFYRLARDWSVGKRGRGSFVRSTLRAFQANELRPLFPTAAGLGGTAAMVLMPRMFAHAHFASYDGTLVACWVLNWAAYAPARRGWAQAVPFGVLLGMTMATKATGWLAPLAFLGAAIVGRDRAGARALAVGIPVALVTFFVLNPPLWHDPMGGLRTFLALNFDRAANPNLNISTWFLGRMYNLDYPLPWYNTLFWTAVTVPVGLLLLAGAGLAAVFRGRRADRAGMVLVANWLVLLVVRALPGVPPHDGVRLFLPAFAFLAALAGVGCAFVVLGKSEPGRVGPERPGRHAPARNAVVVAAVILLYAGSATSLFWYAPQWLSYYNLAIGGLPGATAAGMEPTYYWDGLDRPVLAWLDQNTAEEEKVQIGPPGWEPMDNLCLMQQWGQFRFGFRADAPGRYRWYVLQHRPSAWRGGREGPDGWLVEHGRPALRKTIRSGGLGPWRLDVPLVEVFSYEQYQEACEATSGRRRDPPDGLRFRADTEASDRGDEVRDDSHQ